MIYGRCWSKPIMPASSSVCNCALIIVSSRLHCCVQTTLPYCIRGHLMTTHTCIRGYLMTTHTCIRGYLMTIRGYFTPTQTIVVINTQQTLIGCVLLFIITLWHLPYCIPSTVLNYYPHHNPQQTAIRFVVLFIISSSRLPYRIQCTRFFHDSLHM